MIPTSQVTINTANFITFLNEEMSLGVLPHILVFHQNNLSRSEVVPLQAGVKRYQIPHRAVGNKLKDVYLQDSVGNLKEMTRISDGDIADYNSGISTYPVAFYPEGDSIVMLHSPGDSESVKFIYHMRPNQMVLEDRASKIISINNGAITVDTMSTVFTTGVKYDIIKGTSPYNCIAIDITPISIAGNIITFNAADLPSTIKAGDIVNLAEETIIPQVPPELHALLAQRVVARCLEALGDLNGLQAANLKIAEMELKIGSLIDDRVENAPQKVKNRWGFIKVRRWW
jgi:hypothetical protein